MSPACFNDLLLIRKGGADMTLGAGDTCVGPLETPREWAEKADALRTIFLQTCGEQPRIDCRLDVRVESEVDRGEFLERCLSYAVEPDERVAAIALIPKGLRERVPALLCIHPTCDIGKLQTVGRDPDEKLPPDQVQRAYGYHLVRRGYVVLAPDLLGSGERRYPGLRAFDNGPFYLKHPRWSGTGKDLWDLQRALTVIERIPEADANRIGSIGHSQGGGLTTYLMAVDTRVKVGVNNCGLWPLKALKNPYHIARTGWWIGRPALRPFCLAGKDFPVDVHELMALAAPRPFLAIMALDDWFFEAGDEPLTRTMWENLGMNVGKVYHVLSAEEQFKLLLHVDGHSFPAPMREAAYAFLDQALLRKTTGTGQRNE